MTKEVVRLIDRRIFPVVLKLRALSERQRMFASRIQHLQGKISVLNTYVKR